MPDCTLYHAIATAFAWHCFHFDKWSFGIVRAIALLVMRWYTKSYFLKDVTNRQIVMLLIFLVLMNNKDQETQRSSTVVISTYPVLNNTFGMLRSTWPCCESPSHENDNRCNKSKSPAKMFWIQLKWKYYAAETMVVHKSFFL